MHGRPCRHRWQLRHLHHHRLANAIVIMTVVIVSTPILVLVYIIVVIVIVPPDLTRQLPSLCHNNRYHQHYHHRRHHHHNHLTIVIINVIHIQLFSPCPTCSFVDCYHQHPQLSFSSSISFSSICHLYLQHHPNHCLHPHRILVLVGSDPTFSVGSDPTFSVAHLGKLPAKRRYSNRI